MLRAGRQTGSPDLRTADGRMQRLVFENSVGGVVTGRLLPADTTHPLGVLLNFGSNLGNVLRANDFGDFESLVRSSKQGLWADQPRRGDAVGSRSHPPARGVVEFGVCFLQLPAELGFRFFREGCAL